jgi:hypothetical protein
MIKNCKEEKKIRQKEWKKTTKIHNKKVSIFFS